MLNKIMVIYKTINLINGKIYIGQDSKNNPKYLGSGKLLWRSIKKYGKENFKKEILEECNTKEELNTQEIFWIKKLNSQDRSIGYNITNGGNCIMLGRYHTNETKRKISKSKKGQIPWIKGKHHSKSTKEKLSEFNKGKKPWIKGKKHTDKTKRKMSFSHQGQVSGMKGKKHTDETKRKISKSIKGKSLTDTHKKNIAKSRCIPVLQYNKNGGFIKEYVSQLEAANQNNLDSRNINACCKNKCKTSGGYIWKYTQK